MFNSSIYSESILCQDSAFLEFRVCLASCEMFRNCLRLPANSFAEGSMWHHATNQDLLAQPACNCLPSWWPYPQLSQQHCLFRGNPWSSLYHVAPQQPWWLLGQHQDGGCLGQTQIPHSSPELRLLRLLLATTSTTTTNTTSTNTTCTTTTTNTIATSFSWLQLRSEQT